MGDIDDFFQRRQAAAVLKHGILSRYPLVFATMASANSARKRVVFLDGYAGPGRYDDGSPGSPLLAVETATRTAQWGREVTCLFVEKDPKTYNNLCSTLAQAAPSTMTYQVWPGDVADHVDAALAQAGQDPMLTFLDPFGTALDYPLLTGRLMNRPARAATEVLLNMNLEGVRRIGGLVTTTNPSPRAAATLARMDRFFGGDWWRPTFAEVRDGSGSAALAAQWVADEFRTRVKAQTGYDSFPVPVRRRPGHAPLFLLVLFHRFPYASWKFNEAVSHANSEWRRACWQQDLDRAPARPDPLGQLDLFGAEKTAALRQEATEQRWEEQERQLGDRWVQDIQVNMRDLLRRTPRAKLGNHLAEIYGSTVGLARDTHVNRAWRQLVQAGEAAPKPPGVKQLFDAVIARPE